MTCQFCGNEIDDNADVCFICGQPVAKSAPAYEAPQVPVYEAEPQAPVYAPAPQAPVYAEPQAPAGDPYAQPVAAQQPVQPAPVYTNQPKQKKSKVKDPNKVGGFLLFICAILPIVGAIVYAKNKKNDVRKVQIANATFIGLDIWLFIIIVVCVKKYMLS